MIRPFASVLLVTQLVLLAGPAAHSHALEGSTPSCASMADHTEHAAAAAMVAAGDELAQPAEDCQHCGDPACAVMMSCAGGTAAALTSAQPLAAPQPESELSAVPAVPPTSSTRSLILPPPRA